MPTDKALKARYVSFFRPIALVMKPAFAGRQAQKELCPDYQAFIFGFEHNY